MVIVSGKMYIKPGERENFLAMCTGSILEARNASGNQDFVLSADPIEQNRVNIYEAWDSEEELMSFRGSGPTEDMNNVIEGAEVARHIVASSGPA